jgi:hypothetical protein
LLGIGVKVKSVKRISSLASNVDFGHLSSLKFEYDPIISFRDFQLVCAFNVGDWMGGCLAAQVIILQLCGISCIQRLSRLSSKKKFQ